MEVRTKHYVIFVVFVSAFFLLFVITTVRGSTMPVAMSETKLISNPQYPEIKPRTPPSDPRSYLYWYGRTQGLNQREIDELDRIIECESRWNPKAKNPNSSASGLFQIISSTFKAYGHGDVFDPIDNIKAGVKLYKHRGVQPWQCK